jgi:hypothetical protein
MARAVFVVVLVLALQGCSGMRSYPASDSACALSPASYACQIETYQRAP